jgi:flagellar hook protein FlgE
MSFALSAGVTGLQAHQEMLDIAGNNLANINTTAFKSSRITFSELLSQTIKKASQPTSSVGGTNPQQIGSGVGVSGISPNMTQGNIVNTGNPLDVANEGEGYFVVNDGSQNLYTRAGSFAVDADSNLVDPATGYHVQRIGNEGELDGFQVAGNSNVHVPYDITMPARATAAVAVQGNLSSDAEFATPQTQTLTSNIGYTVDGTVANDNTVISGLDQFSGTLTSGTLTLQGYKRDGTNLTENLTLNVGSSTTLGDVIDWLNTGINEKQTVTITGSPTGGHYHLSYGGQTTGDIAYNATAADVQTALAALSTIGTGNVTCTGGPGPDTPVVVTFAGDLGGNNLNLMTIDTSGLSGGTSPAGSVSETVAGSTSALGNSGAETQATASLVNGRIRIADGASGYSLSDVKLTYDDGANSTFTMPAYFEMSSVGGEEVKNINITVYDSLGGKHVLSGAFVRTDTANTWDMVMTSITGNVSDIGLDDRRIRGIQFDATDGSYTGLDATIDDNTNFVVTFAHDTANPQTLNLSMGTVGEFDGLTQLAGNSTAVAREQDGYAAGRLSTVSVNNEGIVIGAFSNGIKKNISTLQVALFQNTAGLESVGNGYFIPSANSGEAIATQAMTAGAGIVHGGALEKSNADVATEFVTMINAQNGYQANARTIKIANEILRELTNLIS